MRGLFLFPVDLSVFSGVLVQLCSGRIVCVELDPCLFASNSMGEDWILSVSTVVYALMCPPSLEDIHPRSFEWGDFTMA